MFKETPITRAIHSGWAHYPTRRYSMDPRFYCCVIGEVIHRKVDIRYASERHLGAFLRGTWYGETHGHWPYGVPLRFAKEVTPFKREQGMVFVNPHAQSADDYCAELRAQTRQSRINRGADPDTGLMPSVHPSALRKIKQLRVLIEHPNTPENERAVAKMAVNRLVEKAEKLDRKLRS